MEAVTARGHHTQPVLTHFARGFWGMALTMAHAKYMVDWFCLIGEFLDDATLLNKQTSGSRTGVHQADEFWPLPISRKMSHPSQQPDILWIEICHANHASSKLDVRNRHLLASTPIGIYCSR